MHAESGGFWSVTETTPVPRAEVVAVTQRVGPTGGRWTYQTYRPALAWGDTPVLWTDHFMSTPRDGINTKGLAECRVVEGRVDAAAAAFLVPPVAWTSVVLYRRRRRRGTRGFVVGPTPAVSGPA